MQLTENETSVEGVTRPRADIDDIQALGDEIADRHELAKYHFRGPGGLG